MKLLRAAFFGAARVLPGFWFQQRSAEQKKIRLPGNGTAPGTIFLAQAYTDPKVPISLAN